MIKLEIHDAEARLSHYLAQLEAGEVILLCRQNVPIAEIRGLPKASKEARPIGLAKGQFEIPDSFFEPLPDDLLDTFDGKAR